MAKEKKDTRYLKNNDLIKEIMISKQQDKLTRAAENMLILLAERVSDKMFYRDVNDKHDCYQTALLVVFTNWRHFDTEKGTNAFAYYTEVIKRGVARGWNEIYATKGDADVKLLSMDAAASGGDAANGYYL